MSFFNLFRSTADPPPSAPDISRGATETPEEDPLAFARREFDLKYALERDPTGDVRVHYLREDGVVRDSGFFLRALAQSRQRHQQRAEELATEDVDGAGVEEGFADLDAQFIAIAQKRITELRGVQPLERPEDTQEEERKAA